MTIKAKDLVKTRNFVKKFIIMRSRLQAINLKLTVWMLAFDACAVFALICVRHDNNTTTLSQLSRQTAKSTEAMISSMKGVTKAMGAMNKAMNLPHLQKLMQQFQMADAQLEDKTEMMGRVVKEGSDNVNRMNN